MAVEIRVTPTRNPNSTTFTVNQNLIPPGTGLSYSNPGSAQANPLASALFAIRGVQSVWILGNEVQVTKDEKVRWGSIQSRIIETIRRTLNSGG